MLLWIVFISFEAGERICMMLSLRRTLVLVNDESSMVNNYELILYLPFTIAHSRYNAQVSDTTGDAMKSKNLSAKNSKH